MPQVFDGGGQTALPAPTEVSAYQHMRMIEVLVGPLAPVELLTDSPTTAQRRRAPAHAASGQAGLIMDTYAPFSDDVATSSLGLAVVDEQYCLGVDQRDALTRGGARTLVMTATPTPCTIAMSVFGDLDVSALRELSVGRTEVPTTVVPASKEAWVKRVQGHLGEEVRGGGHACVVCPHIEDDDEGLPLALIADVSAELREKSTPAGIGIETIYGRMSSGEEAEAMENSASGRTPVLASTTAVEVDVDVPEATAVVILDADRLDLSQLHQLCGRTGRGMASGVCLVVTSAEKGSLTLRRLKAFASTTDGFTLAEPSLQLRSEGNMLGAAQAGQGSHLRFLSITKDRKVTGTARAAAREAIVADPKLAGRRVLTEAMAAVDAGGADYLERG